MEFMRETGRPWGNQIIMNYNLHFQTYREERVISGRDQFVERWRATMQHRRETGDSSLPGEELMEQLVAKTGE